MFQINAERNRVIGCETDALVLGGPGAGKTTLALLKAEWEVVQGRLFPGQQILFLSFARATVARVLETANQYVSKDTRKCIVVDTYHGFAWKLIQSHGYLVNGVQPRLHPPHEAAAYYAGLKEAERDAEIRRIWTSEGRLHFDLFASVASALLGQSEKLCSLQSSRFPLVILDEFQDTNADQWSLIQCIGKLSRLLALADPDQRIYDFAGADPKRIQDFIDAKSPLMVDLAADNHRSNGTDIAKYGNDLLVGTNKSQTYNDVFIKRYNKFGKGKRQPLFMLKTEVYSAIKRLKIDETPDWTVAVLVPSRAQMLQVSKYFSSTEDGLRALPHEVYVDQEGPMLAATVIAGLLEGGTEDEIFVRLVSGLNVHLRGQKGTDSPAQGELQFADSLTNFLQTGEIRGSARKATVDNCSVVAKQRANLKLQGLPDEDWLQMVQLLLSSGDDRLRKIADHAKYIRILKRGSTLRANLSASWRGNGNYFGAIDAVNNALVQSHFSATSEIPRGIHVMTIHKAKGKEFCESLLFEGAFQGRFVRDKTNNRDVAKARLLLRVGVTRSKRRTTILTPSVDGCPLIV